MTRTNLNIVLEKVKPILEARMREAIEAEGKVYTGELRNSVKARIKEAASSITITVAPDARHAGGRGPGGAPSPRKIESWIRRKGISPRNFSGPKATNDLGFAISKGIARNGTIESFRKSNDKITQHIIKAVGIRLLQDTANAYKKDVEAALNKVKPRDARN